MEVLQYKDFRIGNLLQDGVSKTLLRVIELSEENITTYVMDRSKFPLEQGWYTEPIPLTEEWLLKFGFTEDTAHECFVIYQHESVPFAIEFYDSKIQLVGFNVADSMEHIKYVHQLQNLYFALTGEDIMIKKTEVS